jgi:flagellar basal body-associated protein FliL
MLQEAENDEDASPPRSKSIMAMVVPIGVVAAIVAVSIANAAWISFSAGRRDDKLDNVVESVKEIKTEMYRRSDAEALNLKVDYLERRVTTLEIARQQHVDRITTKVERQEDDILTRAQHWLTGGGKK